MTYYLGNLSNAELARLSSAVWEEKHKRITANISNYPIPLSFKNGVEDIKAYWKSNPQVSLTEAKAIIEYYKNLG